MTATRPALAIGIEDVRAAAGRLHGVAHRTPVLTSAALDEMTGGSIFLKAECFQRVGAFKIRGAYNRISQLTEEERGRGVVTVSSGNHAQAVALAASLCGTTATILMPLDSPRVKVEAVEGYGGVVVTFDRYAEDREALLAVLAEREGRVVVHPFDDPAVMAGQGTVALELIEEVPALDDLFVCVGGGGLIAGCATVFKAAFPLGRVIGVEPEAGDDVRQSLTRGERVKIATPQTIADGQQTPQVGELTFPIIQRHVDDVVTVTDDEIVEAMRFAMSRLKIVLEPSGASALAAILNGTAELAGRRVGVTLSGGNVDLSRLAGLLTEYPGSGEARA